MIWKIVLFIPLYCVWVMVALYGVFSVFTAGLPPGVVPFPAIVLYLVLILIPIWLFTKWMNAEPAWTKKVQAEGKKATATIVSVKNTGMVINNTVAVVKLQLRIEPHNETPFVVNQEKRVSMIFGLGGYVSGARLQVKYDPDNKNHVVILGESDVAPDGGASTRHPSVNPEPARLSRYETEHSTIDIAGELTDLIKMHQNGDLSDAEFHEAKRKLLG